MNEKLHLLRGEGTQFKLTTDTVTIKKLSAEPNGGSSLVHWTFGVGGHVVPHTHERYEETFYLLNGELEVTIGTETFIARAGDYVRVPPTVRHALANKSDRPVEALVGFSPGGMEEFFYEFRTDDREFDAAGFLEKAARVHGTVYEL